MSEPRYSGIIGRPIDNTALSTFTTCPRKFFYSMVLHRRGQKGQPRASLGYGTGFHHAMEYHYKYIRTPGLTKDQELEKLHSEVREYVFDRWQDCDDTEDYRTFPRLMLEYGKYLDKYGLPWEEEYETVGWPDAPLVEIASDAHIPDARHPYAFKIDRIVKSGGQYFVMDHKTGSQERSDFFRQFSMSNQMIGYCASAQQIVGRPIAGVVINAHIVRTRDSVFKRQTIPFGQDRIKAWMKNYDSWLARIEEEMIQHQEHSTPSDTILNESPFPHNFDACAGKYGMCMYAGVCSMSPRLREPALEQDFEVEAWDPMKVDEVNSDA